MPIDLSDVEQKRLKNLTNRDSSRGYETTNVLFKKIKDTDDHRVKFIGINKESGNIQSILNFKQFSAFAKMYRHNKTINKIMIKDDLTRIEAKAEYKKRVDYIEKKQIDNISKRNNISINEAKKFRANLINKGKRDVLDGYSY